MSKLVRDKIVELMKKDGKKVESHTADEKEFELALMLKICEELTEFFADPSVEEAGDVLEAFERLLRFYGLHKDAVSLAQARKRMEKGGFEEGIILDKVEE